MHLFHAAGGRVGVLKRGETGPKTELILVDWVEQGPPANSRPPGT